MHECGSRVLMHEMWVNKTTKSNLFDVKAKICCPINPDLADRQNGTHLKT